MTKHFQIIRSNTGRKVACEILDEPCARCASTYAERQHKFSTTVSGRRVFDVVSVCDHCAEEHLAEKPVWRFGWIWKTLLLLAVCAVSFMASFTFCAWLIVGR